MLTGKNLNSSGERFNYVGKDLIKAAFAAFFIIPNISECLYLGRRNYSI